MRLRYGSYRQSGSPREAERHLRRQVNLLQLRVSRAKFSNFGQDPNGPRGVFMNPVRRTIFGYVFAVAALATAMTGAGQEPAAMQPEPDAATTLHHIKTVFLIVMENHNWTGAKSGNIKGNSSAPYINYTLLPMASY